MIQGLLGMIDKMRIEVYDKKDFKDVKSTIYVQLNPEKYTMKHNVSFCEGQAMGTSGSDLKFNKIEGQEVTFDFLFDSSGILPPGKIIPGKGKESLFNIKDALSETFTPTILNPFEEVKSVEKEVEKFKNLVMTFDGKTHQSPYLKLLWGTYSLDCRIKSMDIEYYVFTKSGKPIRAKVKCLFKETVAFDIMNAKENKQSPDLTHQRIFEMNDTLALLSESIYESNSYYIDVAKSNKLLSFRKIKTGKEISFPPIK